MKIIRLSLFITCVFSTFAFANGFDNNYEVFSGDLNNDGLKDLYVRQKPKIILLHGDIITPIVLPSPVKPFILQQNNDSSFSIVSELPTSQIENFSNNWQPTAINVITGDFNMDGKIDILLEGVTNTVIGSFDQIVFAPNTQTTAPNKIKAIDNEFQKFFKELNSTIYNRNYFSENAPIVTQAITINDTIYLGEWCASPQWVEENGPLENKEPIPTIVRDTLDDIYANDAEFINLCNSTGRTVIHRDFVSVQYQIPAGSKDYSVFNQDAIEASKVLGTVIDNNTLENGSTEKSVLEDIFERVFGTNVFDPEQEQRNPFELLLENITYLAQRDEALSGPINNCPGTPNNINHTAAYARHFNNFAGNPSLSSKISVVNQNSNITITINVTVDALGIDASSAIKGINSWTSCRTAPDGSTIQLNVQATTVLFNGDISFKPQTGISCRDRAQQGGTIMFPCIGKSKTQQQLAAAHEFGHILGFDDVYTGTNTAIPGFENDIMGIGYQIFPYHLLILAQKYGGN